MDDKFTKFSKLYFLIFLLFLSIPILFAFLMSIFYLTAKTISCRPVDNFFELIIISLPPVLFCTIYYIFIKRNKLHNSKAVQIFSKWVFYVGIVASIAIWIDDMFLFFKKNMHNITNYKSFSLLFLTVNIAVLFLIAIIQALTVKKEIDWMDKYKFNN